jgi:hypothetical protein
MTAQTQAKGSASKRASATNGAGKRASRTTAPGSSKAKSNGGEHTGVAATRAASAARAASERGGSGPDAKQNGRGGASRKAAGGARAKRAPLRTRGRAQTSATAKQSNSGESAKRQPAKRKGQDDGSALESVREVASQASKAAIPVATGTVGVAAGIAGGILLGRSINGRSRKVLGVKLPSKQSGFSDVARAMSDTGKQLGKLAGEVRAARQKAEEIGKVLS